MEPTRAVRPRRGRLLLELPLALLLALAGVYFVLREIVGDGGVALLADHQVLVRVNHVRGTLVTDDRPGLHTFAPWFEEVRRLDRRPLRYVMGDEEVGADRCAPALIVRGREGSSYAFRRVEVQVYAQRADLALVDLGGDRESIVQLVDVYARPVLRHAFGRYTPREIVLPDNKQAASREALLGLDAALARHGVRVLELSVSKPKFLEEYQETIHRRQVADQDTERLKREREQLLAARDDREADVRSLKERELADLERELAESLRAAQRAADRLRAESDQETDDRLVAVAQQRDEALARAAVVEARHRAEAEAFVTRLAALESQGELAVRAALVERLGTIQFELAPFEREAVHPRGRRRRGRPRAAHRARGRCEMTVRNAMTKTRAFLADLAGATLDMFRAAGRSLRRGWKHMRPRAIGAWRRVRPRLARAWAWLRARGLAAWTRLRPRAEAAWAWLRSRGRRPLVMAARTLLIAAAIGGLLLGAGRAFVHRAPPGVIAVRQVKWGGGGVIERDHGPGLHWTIAGRDTWHRLPARVHLIHFAWENEGGTQPILEVATREGEAAQAAVLVPYRIKPGEGWQLVADGLRTAYSGRAVAICRRVLLEELAELSAGEFADPEARARVEASALARLEGELGATHLEPLDVRIGSMFFNPTYEKKMLEKQLAAQDGLTQASLAARKVEQRENQRVLAELERAEAQQIADWNHRLEELRDQHTLAVGSLERGAKRYAERRTSETDIAVLGLSNEGELTLAAAADLRRGLFDDALQTGAGRLHVARQAAENLRFGKVTLNSNDPRVPSVLDLDEMVELLMGTGGE